MFNVETGRDTRFIPQAEGAIEIKSRCGQKIMAYPGTFLFTLVQKAIGELAKEEENVPRKNEKEN